MNKLKLKQAIDEVYKKGTKEDILRLNVWLHYMDSKINTFMIIYFVGLIALVTLIPFLRFTALMFTAIAAIVIIMIYVAFLATRVQGMKEREFFKRVDTFEYKRKK